MPGFTQIPNDEVFDDPLWTASPFTKGQAYIDLYRLAVFKKSCVEKRGAIIDLEPGQIGYSMDSLARRWKWSYGKAKRFLKQLEKKGKIEMQKTSVSTTITLAHFVENGKQMENKRKTNGQQTENKRSPINIDKNNQIEKIDNTILHSAAKAPQLINIFGEEFKSYTDTEYHASFGKDRKILKSLEDHYGRDDVIAGIKYFFQVYIRKDRFSRKNPNVGMLQTVWNGMVASAKDESRHQREMEDWVNE